jgi:hypothetical protein
MYHPQIVRAVQNHRHQDWDAVGVPELEGGAEGGPELSPPALLMFTTFMTEFFLVPNTAGPGIDFPRGDGP